jgi:hypothetical protein
VTQSYTIYTLVDITNSNVTNVKSTNTHGYNQQQNLNTLLQLISLRSQPIEVQINKLMAQDVVKYGFGKQFSGLHTVWKLDFISEHTDVFNKDDNEVYFLEHDCDGAAFTAKLDETVKFKTNTFEVFNKNTVNIRFLKV